MGPEAAMSREKLDAVLGVPRGAPSRPLDSGNFLSRFARGFGLPLRALKLILSDGPLFRWSALTAGISAVLLVGLAVLLYHATSSLLGLIWDKPEDWLRFVWYGLAVLIFSGLFVLGANTIPPIATAPLTDPLTATAEKLLGAPVDSSGGLARMAAETANATVKAVIRLSLLYLGHAVLLLFWLLPGIGQAIWTPLSVAWTIYWLAYEYLDIPANRHGYRFSEVIGVVGNQLGLCLGFGSAVYLILWIPLLNVLFIPVAAVGATILFVDLRASGALLPSAKERAALLR